MNQLKLKYYKSVLLQIKRGNNRGIFSNAKPILVISIFDSISNGIIEENKIYFLTGNIESIYANNYLQYAPQEKKAPFYMPFFHLSSDEFWHLLWQDGCQPEIVAHTPSAKYLRENVKYATLDNALWDLLQDAQTRTILRDTIINYFFNSEKHKLYHKV